MVCKSLAQKQPFWCSFTIILMEEGEIHVLETLPANNSLSSFFLSSLLFFVIHYVFSELVMWVISVWQATFKYCEFDSRR